MTAEFLKASSLIFVLLNPFSMSVYLADLLHDLDLKTLARVLIRAGLISTAAFCGVALLGDRIFTDILHARFAAFLLFGGITFLIVALKMVFQGAEALRALRGAPEHLAGSVAMPFMIGPGTISASLMAGARLPPHLAVAAIAAALIPVVGGLCLLKLVMDHIKRSHEPLVSRYVDVVGRIMALVVGTYAIEMMFQAVDLWRAGVLGIPSA